MHQKIASTDSTYNFSYFISILRSSSFHLRKRMFFLLFTMIISSFFEVLSIGSILPLITYLSNPEIINEMAIIKNNSFFLEISNSDNFLILLALFFILFIVISAFLRSFVLISTSNLSHKIGEELSHKVFLSAIYQPFSKFSKVNSSTYISAISSKITSIIGYIIMPGFTFLSSLIFIFIILVSFIYVNIQVAFFILIICLILFLPIVLLTKSEIKKNSLIVNKNSDFLIKHLQEAFGAIRDIILDNSQIKYFKIFKVYNVGLHSARSRLVIISSLPKFIIEALSLIALVCVIIFLTQHTSFTTLIPILTTVLLAVQRLLPQINAAFSNLAMMRGGEEMAKDILYIIKQNSINSVQTQLNDKKIHFRNYILLSNVTFSYSKGAATTLSDVTLKIERGQVIGITGPSGCGKSTLLDLLMGLLTPTSGSILIDDIELNTQNIKDWQRIIAHVPQNIFIADTTIEQNIALSSNSDKIDPLKINAALHTSGLFEFVQTLPNQEKTILGEHGSRLSGGQKQRIGIARAFYKDAEILIFDEATSALDEELERAITLNLRSIKSNYTIFIVAHRKSSLSICDKIFVLDQGRVKFECDFNEYQLLQSI